MKPTAVIVNYNAGEILRESVGSALDQCAEVVLIDNASSDQSVELVEKSLGSSRRLRIIRNQANAGFAVACNQGIGLADPGRDVLLLNPDCILHDGAIGRLLEELGSGPHVGMVGGLLLNPDGSEQAGGRRAVPTPWRSFVRAFGLSGLGRRWPRLFSDFCLHQTELPSEPIAVEAISGALMLISRRAIEDAGLLDEDYFMHCEDLDFCMRLRQRGWMIMFVPGAKATHHQGSCSRSVPLRVEFHKHRGMVHFYRKFFSHQYPAGMLWVVIAGVWLRFAFHGLRLLLRRPFAKHAS